MPHAPLPGGSAARLPSCGRGTRVPPERLAGAVHAEAPAGRCPKGGNHVPGKHPRLPAARPWERTVGAPASSSSNRARRLGPRFGTPLPAAERRWLPDRVRGGVYPAAPSKRECRLAYRRNDPSSRWWVAGFDHPTRPAHQPAHHEREIPPLTGPGHHVEVMPLAPGRIIPFGNVKPVQLVVELLSRRAHPATSSRESSQRPSTTRSPAPTSAARLLGISPPARRLTVRSP